MTPQAQIYYSHVKFDDFIDAYDAAVSQQNRDRVTGRIGMSIDYTQGESKGNQLTGYGIANLYQQFSGASRVNVNNVTFSQENERTWLGVGGGSSTHGTRGNMPCSDRLRPKAAFSTLAKAMALRHRQACASCFKQENEPACL